jgi:DNA-binding ferritin-like protein (Dps family)
MFLEKIVGELSDKRRWWQYKARVEAEHGATHP